MVYTLLPPVMMLLGVISCNKKTGKIGRAVYCVLFTALITFIQAIRYDVGTDYKSYKRIFTQLIGQELGEFGKSRLEKGYTVMLNIFANDVGDFRVYFALSALLFAGATGYWIYKYSSMPVVSCTAFVMYGMFFYSMNFLRQYTAAVVVLYSYEYIKKHDFLRFAAMVLFASCFHWSALIMLPMYFILQIRIQPVVLAIYSLISVLLFMGSTGIIQQVIDLFDRTGIMTRNLRGLMTGQEISYGVFPFYFIGYFILFILMVIFRKRAYEADKTTIIYLSSMFFLVMFEFWGLKHAIVSRFGMFFVMPGVLGMLPETIKAACGFTDDHFKQKKIMHVLVIAVFLAAASYFYGAFMVYRGNGCFPYQTWLPIFQYL
ncbi:MAG: EpsG family protein [Oscillospiraceae bacterium]|nr:EpsG family protein [Oscillospiraceae bacterium]